jgi:alpha-mannosidase
MKRIRVTILLLFVGVVAAAGQGSGDGRRFLPLSPDGVVPLWRVAGPFEQPTTGFGIPVDADSIGERAVRPACGDRARTALAEGGEVRWEDQSVDASGYLDISRTVGWTRPGRSPEKVWIAKAAYAWADIVSPADQEYRLLVGSNSSVRVILNGVAVHVFAGTRPAVRDQDTIRVALRKGSNTLMLKVGNTHQNYWLDFFGMAPWGWGAYARFVSAGGGPASDLQLSLHAPATAPALELESTFFFTGAADGLRQRVDLVVHAPWTLPAAGTVRLTVEGKEHRFDLPVIRCGTNRYPLEIPALARDQKAVCVLEANGETTRLETTLRAEKKYELHLMFLTHTDIGYTHIQPVVREMHVATLDNVLSLCRKDSAFRWTIETVWQLQQFEQARPAAAFEELMGYIRAGRIAVSPFLTNPYTGWVSEEELVRSVAAAGAYASRYGISFHGAVYNDVPGLAWGIPAILESAGVSLIACGINEVYGGYTLQQSLPKAFTWEGPGGSRVIVYRSETYNEGAAYGLERDDHAIEQRMWDRLHKLRATGDDREMVLLDAAWMDNGGVAVGEFEAAKRWNRTHAYPRFVFTTAHRFADEFSRRYGPSLPVLRGDWTSAWDIRHQGEPARVVRERWAQSQIVTAERFAALDFLRDSSQIPFTAMTRGVYESLLGFSGHGSGLEAGYGTLSDNALTLEYREHDVASAVLGTKEVLARSIARMLTPETSFDGEGIMVFNPLSYPCDVPLALEMKDSSGEQLALTTMGSGIPVPSYREGRFLYLVAPQVPPLGYKKLALHPAPRFPVQGTGNPMQISSSSVSNQFYRLTFDPLTHEIASIVDRALDRELITAGGPPFGEPLKQEWFNGRDFSRVPADSAVLTVLDQRPARVVVSIVRPGNLMERTNYILWNNVQRVDIEHEVVLDRLTPPATAETYAVAFPFALAAPDVRMDGVGGFLSVPGDRLPGAITDAYALRRTAGLSDGTVSVAWSAADSRVAYWQPDRGARPPVLLAVLTNNFPVAWNRHEENRGRLTFRFSLCAYAGKFDARRTARLGLETQTEFPAYRSWFRAAPAETSFVSVTGENVVLQALKPAEAGDGVILRLMNVSPDRATTASVASPLFRGLRGYESDVLERTKSPFPLRDGAFSVRLRASEVRTVRLEVVPDK